MSIEGYADGYSRWRPPSPYSTPRSAASSASHPSKPHALAPSVFNQSPPVDFARNWPDHPELAHHTSPPSVLYAHNAPMQTAFPDHAFAQSTFQDHNYGLAPMNKSRSPNAMNHSFSNPSFPSNSFLEQFEDATIHDQTSAPVSFAAVEPLPSQMQTPPPTRDASNRRLMHHTPAMALNPPDLTTPRRLSVPQDSWPSGGYLGTSPFGPSALQFSPARSSPFELVGPATVPAYPPQDLFWDPHANDAETTNAIHGIHNPFIPLQRPHDQPFAEENAEELAARPRPGSLASARQPGSTRSHSTLPSITPLKTAKPRSNPSSPLSAPPGVDPSLIWTAQDISSLSAAQPSGSHHHVHDNHNRPYQYHLDELRREKELGRQRKGIRTVSGPALPYQWAGSGALRRSATDSRTRMKTRNVSSQASNSLSDTTDSNSDIRNASIPRTSSPLKRQRFESHDHPRPPSRRAVVLTVDDTGRARTEVRTALESATRNQTPSDQLLALEDDSELSDPPESSSHSRNSSQISLHESRTMRSPARMDAQSELRQVMRERHNRRHLDC